MAELEAMRANKAEKRGGFKEKIFLDLLRDVNTIFDFFA